MALTDFTNPEPQFTAADATLQIRQIAARNVNMCRNQLKKLNELVGQFGRSAIASELGTDAQGMLDFYNSLKTHVETFDPGITIDDLPS
jgi:hypothetical protein